MLSQLLMMGFKIDQIKLALEKCNYESINAAMDILMDMQSKDEFNKRDEEKNIILENWSCTTCTYINNNDKTVCEVCGSPAPANAYVNV